MFHVAIDGVWTLGVDEVWPDGDAPENPTAADVLAVMRDGYGLRGVIDDWNLQPTLTVNGEQL